MRIAVFGPVGKSESQLDRALDLAFSSLLVDRAVYLGDPELVRRRRRTSVVDATETLWTRSLRCLNADAAVIERFVASERRKLDWARLELLGDSGSRSVLLSGERVLFLCEQESQAAADVTARVVVCPADRGECETFTAEDDGTHLRLSPGTLDNAGVVVVCDENELAVEVYDLRGKRLDRNVLEPS